MKSFRYGHKNSWLDKDQESYFTLAEAWSEWFPPKLGIDAFLFVYEDEELILVFDLKDRVEELLKRTKYDAMAWRKMHLNASRDELAKHGIKLNEDIQIREHK